MAGFSQNFLCVTRARVDGPLLHREETFRLHKGAANALNFSSCRAWIDRSNGALSFPHVDNI